MVKKILRRELTRAGSRTLRRAVKKRPWLGLLLLAAAAAFLYFRPHLPDLPGLPFPDQTPSGPSGTVSGTVSGRVTRVSDGDTLILRTAEGEVKVRLYGVDAPEMKQARGRESHKFLYRLAHGQNVRLEVNGRDQYGRVLGRVFVGDLAVDRQMVAAGQAWVYENYCQAAHCRELRRLQAEAKAGRQGLWRDKNPQPPWVWRRENSRR